MSDAPRTATPAPISWRWLALVWIVALAVRLAGFAAIGPTRLVGDEHHYLTTARSIASGAGHWNGTLRTAAQWPPGQAAFLALASDGATASVADDTPAPRAAVLAEILAGSVIPVATCLLGALLFGPSAGLAAGVIAAVHPELVAYSQFLWSENLFTALVTLAAAIALSGATPPEAGARPPGLRSALISGLLFGLAILTREEGALVALAVFAASLTGNEARARAARRIALVSVVTIAVVAPWSVRNARLLGRLVPVSTVGWMGAAEGNVIGSSWLHREPGAVRAWRERYFAIDGDVARMDFARASAIAAIADAQPTWIVRKLVLNLPRLWSPDSFLFRKLGVRTADAPALGWLRAALVTQVIAHLTVVGLAILGLAGERDRRRRSFGALTIASITALHVVANASSRYRLPLVPILTVYAAAALVDIPTAMRNLGRRQRALAIALLAGLVLCSASFAPKAAQLWMHGVGATSAAAE
ncbi:MAG: glycosyltransferase family 39 protein [bacterium]